MNANWANICREDLAAGISAQEEGAYREFADYFGPRFKGYFMRQDMKPSDAEELAVSCVTDIALKVPRYKTLPNGCFSAWVFALARRALANWYRKARHEISLDALDPGTEALFASEEEPDLFASTSAITKAVEAALSKLSETDRTIIRMRYFGGEYTYEEIARTPGIDLTPGAVRVRHHRALAKLQTQLQQDAHIQSLLSKTK